MSKNKTVQHGTNANINTMNETVQTRMKAKNEMFPQSHIRTKSAGPVAANNRSNNYNPVSRRLSLKVKYTSFAGQRC